MSSSLAAKSDSPPTSRPNDKHDDSCQPSLLHYKRYLGIGDVFLEPPGHALPMTYLSGAASATFVSTEIVGRLKSTPQDFVVQEIMNLSKKLLGTTDETDGLQVATFNNLPLQEPALPTTEPTNSDTLQPNPSQTNHAGNKDPPDTMEIDWRQAQQQPKESLRAILKNSQLKLVEPQRPDQLLQALSQLQSRVAQGLNPAAHQQNEANTETTTNDFVKIVLNGKSDRQDRGYWHKWVRCAFSLLQTEAVENNDDSSVVTIHARADDRFFGLVPFLHDPMGDVVQLYSFFRLGDPDQESHGKQQKGRPGLQCNQPNVSLPLRVDLKRSQRRQIHQLVAEKSGRQLHTETQSDYVLPDGRTTAALIVTWSHKQRVNRKRKRNETLQDGSQFVLLVLQKRNVEHTAAMHLLSKALHCRPTDIQYAGIKDRQAITTQYITLNRHVPTKRILASQRSLRSHGLDLCGPLLAVKEGLQKGQAVGNRFIITLRDVRQIRVVTDQSTGQAREEMIPCQPENLDKAVERIRQRGFVNFYGEQRIGLVTIHKGPRPIDIGSALLRQDWENVIDLIMRSETDANSARVSKVWQESQKDATETWKALSKSQGKESRQRVILQSLKRYGADNPMVIVESLSNFDRTFWINVYQSLVWNVAATERVRMYGSDKVVVGDIVEESSSASTADGPVLVTSEEMAQRFIMEQVVLPLPGYDILYPSNKIGQVYRDLLAMDGIKFVKTAPLDATAKGAYRSLIAKATNLEHDWLNVDDEPVCRFRFDLPTGCYATMLLRELLRTTVAR